MKEDRPYKVVLVSPDEEVLLTSYYGGGVSIPEDIADDLHKAYAKHRESRGLKTAFWSTNEDGTDYCV